MIKWLLITLALEYVFGAFVNWDIFWVQSIPEWGTPSRALFLGSLLTTGLFVPIIRKVIEELKGQ